MDTSAPISQTIYLQGKNTGSRNSDSAYLVLEIIVCATLSLTPAFSLNYDFLRVPGSIKTIPSSTYMPSITGDCTMDTFELVYSPVTDSNGYVTSYTANSNSDFSIQ